MKACVIVDGKVVIVLFSAHEVLTTPNRAIAGPRTAPLCLLTCIKTCRCDSCHSADQISMDSWNKTASYSLCFYSSPLPESKLFQSSHLRWKPRDH